jgi:hypothetical protein
MKKLALVLAAAAFAGCEAKKESEKPAAKAEEGSGSGSSPKMETAKPKTETAKPTRKVVDPSKKGQIATYKCGCTGNTWTQPAEEEKLCINDCEGKMPECGTLVKVEPAGK